jgi:hypothetical protein
MMTTNLDPYKSKIAAAQAAIDLAHAKKMSLQERRYTQFVVPEMRRRIGNCYRYSNRYGGSESWWMYTKIIGLAVLEYGYKLLTIQQDCHEKIEISIADDFPSGLPDLMSGYEPMDEDEWAKCVWPILTEAMQHFRMRT